MPGGPRRAAFACAAVLCALLPAPGARAAEPGIETVLGGRSGRIPATEIGFNAVDVALGPQGALYVATSALGTGTDNGLAVGNGAVYRLGADGFVTRVAGTGSAGPLGDGGPADRASLLSAAAIAVDSAGTLLIADRAGHRVRRVTPAGVVSTFAGTGVAGFAGDGGAAAQAQLNGPNGVAFDAAGNVFISDGGNARVRKVTPAGTISTVAGRDRVSGVSPAAVPVEGVPGTQAFLGVVAGLAVTPAGVVYVAEPDARRVRRIAADGTITTLAGNGSTVATGLGLARYGGEEAPPLDADQGWRNATAYTGDGGPAAVAALTAPFDVAVGPNGDVLVADGGTPDSSTSTETNPMQRRVRAVNAAGTIRTVAGDSRPGYAGEGGPATAASLVNPHGVAVDAAGSVYVADGPRVLKVAPNGTVTTVAGAGRAGYGGDGLPPSSAHVRRPRALAADAAGVLYAGDGSGTEASVRRVADDRVTTLATSGLDGVKGLAVDAAGDLLVAEASRVWKVTRAGRTEPFAGGGAELGDGGPATQARITSIESIAVDAARNVYVADTYRVRRIDASGVITTVAGTGANGTTADGGPAKGTVVVPVGVAVGPAGDLYIAERSRLRKVDRDGRISTVAGTGAEGADGDGGPAVDAKVGVSAVAVDAAGRLFLADEVGHRVRMVDQRGEITTVAGTGTAGYGGDGGVAAQAQVSAPSGLLALHDGSLLVADSGNDRVRAIRPPRTAALTLAAAPAKVAPGRPVRLSGVVTAGGAVLAAVPVELLRRPATSKGAYAVVARGTTDASGRYAFTDKPKAAQSYLARYAGSPLVNGASSRAVTVVVSAQVR
jgi:sugar lactone lactonase YvrE